jgi:hypothetical protein
MGAGLTDGCMKEGAFEGGGDPVEGTADQIL